MFEGPDAEGRLLRSSPLQFTGPAGPFSIFRNYWAPCQRKLRMFLESMFSEDLRG